MMRCGVNCFNIRIFAGLRNEHFKLINDTLPNFLSLPKMGKYTIFLDVSSGSVDLPDLTIQRIVAYMKRIYMTQERISVLKIRQSDIIHQFYIDPLRFTCMHNNTDLQFVILRRSRGLICFTAVGLRIVY